MYALTAKALKEQAEYYRPNVFKQVLIYLVDQAKLGQISALLYQSAVFPGLEDKLKERGFKTEPAYLGLKVSWDE